MISESDWKKFKAVKEAALNKLCGAALEDCSEAMCSQKSSNHGKYLLVYRLLQNYDKQISMIFDFNSRSKALMQLGLMKSEGLLEESDILSFSEELQEFINRH